MKKLPANVWQPRSGAVDHYPLDLDGSERFTRYVSGKRPTPYPNIIGAISAILPFFDATRLAAAIAKTPYGPGSYTYPINLQWQINVEGLQKQSVPQ